MKKNNYIGKVKKYRMLIVHVSLTFLLKYLFLLSAICLLSGLEVKAQYNFKNENEDATLVYDEIPVLVMVEGYGNFYSEAIYTNRDSLYINIKDLFTTLNIPCNIHLGGNSLEGFIENENQIYLIDFETRQIKIGSRIINANNRLLKESGAIYMESSLLAEVFGIVLTFNFRSLTVILKSDFELPVIKQQRLEKLRNNISKLKGENVADTLVRRNYHLFKAGMIDWSLGSFQTINGSTNNRFSIGIGTELLFGEADISVNYDDLYKFDNRQLYYLWRWVDNDKSIIKQAQVGKISNQTISFINSPIIGAVIRNSPTTVRKAKGYYTINEFTEPNWTVELYVNNVMVDYTRADASGLYMFKVPIVYGYTTLKLKFYGPMGEERTDERTMNMPYTVMPVNEFEYSLSGGMVQDSSSSRFGRAEFNYGVNRFFTVGGGLEYLSSIINGPYIPFATATIQPYSKLTLNVEYAHGVKARGLLNYYLGKNTLLEIDYAKFVEGQLATRFNALEERKVKLSIPFRYKKFTGFSKFDYSQFVYKAFNFNQANIMVSSYYKQFNANLSTQLNWIDNGHSFVSSDLALSYRLKKGYIIRPSAQYNISEDRFLTYKVDIEKSILKGYFTFTYEKNVSSNDNYISLNFKYDLDFARTNLNISRRESNFVVSESAQGSLAFGSGNNYVFESKNTSVSKGGISLYPFLDLNQNGIFDKDECMVKLTSVKVMGSKAIFSEKDSIVRIADLNAFTSYMVDFDDKDLENVAWRFKFKRYQVLIDPNQFKRIDVPVISVGEVSGMAYKNINSSLKGIGRILVKIYQKNSHKLVAETLSESDGYIYYLGLEPGEYFACVDSVQLTNLDLAVNPQQIDFTIKSLKDGEMVGNIDFILETGRNVTLNTQNGNQEPEIMVSENIIDTLIPSGNTISPSEKQKNEQPESSSDLSEQFFIYEGEKYPSWIKIIPVEDDEIQPVKKQKGNQIKSNPKNPANVFINQGEKIPSSFQNIAVEQDSITQLEKQKNNQSESSTDNLEGVYIYEGQKYPSSIRIIPVNEKNTPKSEIERTKQQKPKLMNGQFSVVIDTIYNITDDTLYKVQLLASKKTVKIDEYFSRLLANVPGLMIFEAKKDDGLFRYSTGAFKDIIEARELMKVIRQFGWEDCFLAIYAEKELHGKTFRLKREIY